ncbi:hypothetical protein BDY24DRAFT_418543 [Mrakia frigida]|uniref:uncharacterized protein n=1 Tax=Mrakia frigida TaxID=29902 RepID=UPI003FCC07B0
MPHVTCEHLSNNKYRLARGLVVLARQDDTTEIVPTETAVIIETEVPEPTGTGLSTTEIDPFAPTEIATASVPVETETAIDSFAPTEILTTGIPEDTEIESSEVDTVITTTTPTDEFTTTTTTSTRVVPASTTRITTPPPTAARSISTTQAVLFPPNGSDATLSVSSPTSSAVGDSDAGAPASHLSLLFPLFPSIGLL